MKDKLETELKTQNTKEAQLKTCSQKELDANKKTIINNNQFKNNLKDGVENTQNPMVQRAVAAADIVYTESSCAKAIKNM